MDKESSTDEIEITPAMIEAGADAFYADSDWGQEPVERAVERIYRAMRLAFSAEKQDR